MEARPASVVPVLLFGLAAFASSPILVRLAGDVPPASVIALRTALAAVLLVPLWPKAYRELATTLDRRDRGQILLGGVFLAAHFATWIESLALTSVASASVLVSTSPLFLAFVSQFVLRRSVPALTWGAVLIGVIGAALIGVGGAGSVAPGRAPGLGNGLALLAAALFGGYLVVGGQVRQRLSWAGFMVPVYTLVAALLVAYAAARGVLGAGWTLRVVLLCAAMALGPQLLGHGAFGFAMRYVSPVLLGLLTLVEPLGASGIAYALFGERPGPVALGGMLVTLAAVATALIAPARKAGAHFSASRSEKRRTPPTK